MNGVLVAVYSKSKDGMTKLPSQTGHFKVREFACKDNSDVIFIAPALVNVLEQIRMHFNAPVVINSAYRTPGYNRRVGGATYSQHQYGTAADITVTGVAPGTVADYARSILPNYGGIGRYKNFTHIDVRKQKANWNG